MRYTRRMSLRLLVVVCTVLAVGFGGSSALAKPPGYAVCSGGDITGGPYAGLTVTGSCTVQGALTINGNVRVANGAYLDAAYSGTMLTINGNVSVGKGAKLGLGCTYGYHDCGFTPDWLGNITVNGNVSANGALTVYLDFVTIRGNVVSNGGGDISLVDHPPAGDGLVLPIKDNVIGGNVIIHGWQGAWFGIIRNDIGGNVMASHTVGTRIGEDGPDSTEIVTNSIAGNLICQGNSPAAQIGDSGGTTNTVDGNKIGECATGGL
jgi:hypothetical protein